MADSATVLEIQAEIEKAVRQRDRLERRLRRRIRRILKDKNLSQGDLAVITGLSRKTVSLGLSMNLLHRTNDAIIGWAQNMDRQRSAREAQS